MRILWIKTELLHPIDKGGKIRTFQMLRSNDLVWSRMVREYLMGERRPMTELMAWNADATRMPSRMHSQYLRQLFLGNELAEDHFTVASKPVALTEGEVSSILFRSDTSKEKPRLKVKFQKSESVRITEGPFANFNGVVDDVNEDRETLKVMVTIFGRSTPVELDFGKVEKIA